MRTRLVTAGPPVHGERLDRPERTLRIRGRSLGLVPPRLHDPRLQVAAVITTVQILGQTSFDFELSIAQILLSLVTCAVIDVAVTMRTRHLIAWPASALLAGNGIALLLRVNGTRHGDWWSLRGWWIFAGTAAVAMLSKYLIRWRTGHVFNPSNIGLVVCFLALGSQRVNPQDLWWAPVSPALVFVQVVIVVGGLVIATRLGVLAASVTFWIVFVAGVGAVALSGHSMTARWHVGAVEGATYWWILATSPEVLIFLFFMITDPQTIPRGRSERAVFGGVVGILGALLVASQSTEFGTKVALLAALTVACAARPLLERVTIDGMLTRPARTALAAGGFVAALMFTGSATRAHVIEIETITSPGDTPSAGRGPPVTIDPAVGDAGAPVSDEVARAMVAEVVEVLAAEPGRTYEVDQATVLLVRDPERPQSPPVVGVRVTGTVVDGASEALFDRIFVPSASGFIERP